MMNKSLIRQHFGNISLSLFSGTALLCLFLLISPLCLKAAISPQKTSLLQQMSTAKKKNTQLVNQLDLEIQNLLNTKSKMTPDQLYMWEQKLLKLREEKKDLAQKQYFWDRLSFITDSKYSGQNFKTFITQCLEDMSKREMKNGENNSYSKFLRYLKQSLSSVNPENRDVMDYIISYVHSSSVSRPLPPKKFHSLQDFTNGQYSYKAKNVNPETVGDLVEKRIQKIEKLSKKNSNESPAVETEALSIRQRVEEILQD